MEAKLRAVEKFQKIQQKHRDRMSVQLESLRQQHTVAQQRLQQLMELKRQAQPRSSHVMALHREALLNRSRVDQMLHKLILHQEHEQEVMQAQCTSLQKQLENKHLRVKGLENTLERWKEEHNSDIRHKEELALEEIINSRFAQKAQ
ncbi:flagellar export protein FliJ [Vibrio coralliilyticus]|uniref:flagellar export protein FliJ n=1 Tax=Vibrio TaxID=662 RepID=UPI000504FA59|nr:MULTISPECIES: flagellar export protein FliJ [Vibrio]KFI13935.1 flagellar export protein FliJ [Vibrio sp. B183]NOI19605.1 flagellar export protein FliJ [Vibrio coralliilyticus]